MSRLLLLTGSAKLAKHQLDIQVIPETKSLMIETSPGDASAGFCKKSHFFEGVRENSDRKSCFIFEN